ncbi:MAG: alpha-amylase/4-alpha-glucanotransferase domain-containing protein [Methylophilaceae bacterium]|jgi:alpha-amylase/alpha-mannosidase (GH57 family)|uniref:alpha-amylase/4-alpha-glucanotransferase domain-containing protein n=1 Tax=Methylobacillus sp. MM3 TaxID=1848039 RepID=UPI0007E2A1C7|nr:alpha-amylase/4-alpha-glucanotransferase domain-containing protein [Methylobacillus sp. MM3]OAJ71427.1 glycosyl hydrolase [Methylobacillus sp. MM3]
MARKVALLLGVHAHQPVGNFTHVLDDAHVRCYGPFLQVLHRYPDFHFAIHLSGWLLDYMLQHYPQDMQLLKDMVKRGQVELFGAGYTEPVLAAIPSVDRVGQIAKLSDYLHKKLGQRPRGAWLTERVWESSVVPSLGDADIGYVTVDDYHFLCAGKEQSALNGYFTTEEDGRKLDLFPISEALRYRLPFSPADEVVSYLESMADESGQAAAVYFDDIEKFGIWPETYAWVYERGWLRDFIEGVLNSDIIQPMRYSDYHAMARTRGVVYLPTTSYIEMNEWTLPVPAAHHYADLVEQEKHSDRYETTKPFVRGGIWRNFFMRFPESNWMHKRMLALSARFHALPEKNKTPEMLHELYEAQANDAYWHGLFGGLYLPHLRRAIYNAMVRLEAMLDKVAPRPERSQEDLDLDGSDELFLQNGALQAVIRLDGSASVCEFDAYKLAHNFGDTLARQTEHYHRKVHADRGHDYRGEGIANPHERMGFKHEIFPEDLATDDNGLTLFRDSWAERDGAISLPVVYEAPKAGKTALAGFSGSLGHGEVTKKIALKGSSLQVAYRFAKVHSGIFRVEINLAMPSCDGPAGRFRIGQDIPGGFAQPLRLASMKELLLEDEVLGGAVGLSCSVPCLLNTRPHFSVSQSEAGFEKIMQAVTLELTWHMNTIEKGVDIQLEVL